MFFKDLPCMNSKAQLLKSSATFWNTSSGWKIQKQIKKWNSGACYTWVVFQYHSPTFFPVLLDVSKCCAPISAKKRFYCLFIQMFCNSKLIGKIMLTICEVLNIMVVYLPRASVRLNQVTLGTTQVYFAVLKIK